MFVGLELGVILFISWLVLGAVSIFLATFLCHLALGKIAGGIPAAVCACIIGIAAGAFVTAWLLAHILWLYFPWMTTEFARRMLPIALVVGGALGGWAAFFLTRRLSGDLSGNHN
jgi:hypothetical protein